MSTRRSALLRTVLIATLLHFVFTVDLPLVILWSTGASPLPTTDIGQLRWLGAAAAAFGAYLYVSSAARLLRSDTSATPGARPSVLVTDGWYARTRNPLLLGVVTILVGEAVLFWSAAVAGYALLYWLCLTVFVIWKEEPDLRQAFGARFDDYCREVPRWIPRF